MIPLALLLLLCVYITTERSIVIERASKEDSNFMQRIKGYIHEGEIESALNLAAIPIHPLPALSKKAYRESAPNERCCW